MFRTYHVDCEVSHICSFRAPIATQVQLPIPQKTFHLLLQSCTSKQYTPILLAFLMSVPNTVSDPWILINSHTHTIKYQ